MPIKYIFITGGVVSSLGKGLTAASLAMLLEKRGIKVAMLKFDPYINVDPGTMSPFQHGEIYVTDDGSETDLDLGHYYRFTHSPLNKTSNATSGKIWDTVIKKERRGDYLGKTVQVIPHITDEIKNRITLCAEQVKGIQAVFIEIGGTVGDIESLPFLEAIRQFRNEHKNDCINLHLTYVPYIKAAGEMKTKPTQHSVQLLREIGIQADMIFCRCEHPLNEEHKEKIALFCNVSKDDVIEERDVEKSIYEVPLALHTQEADEKICNFLNLRCKTPNIKDWVALVNKITHLEEKITIGVVGKYLDHADAYKSIFEALNHAAIFSHRKLEIRKIDSEKLEKDAAYEKQFLGLDGILVPGGFGERGWEGKILAIQYARTKKIPFFGICLGLQAMLVEFARHVIGYNDANSTEIQPHTQYPVIALMEEQKVLENLGATQRLGAFPCQLAKNTKAFHAYRKNLISERHRHRYEFNNEYKKAFEKKGIVFSGTLHKGNLIEIAEIKHHPWMVGVQFHPEFKSKPLDPHPLFKAFVHAIVYKKKK